MRWKCQSSETVTGDLFETFLKCAELMGVNPSAYIVFEDAEFGLQAVKAAQMRAIDVHSAYDIENDYFN